MEAYNDFILEVTNLSVKIQNQIILEDVNFKLKKGTTLAIVGPNGAGKSILFKTLLNLIPYSGKIKWNDKVKTGYIPQIISVKDVPISVKEFLTIQRNADIEYYLNSVGLEKDIMNESIGILSGGQFRRVLIAYAIMDKPNVLLFDEPTTGVDIDSEEAIYEMLKKFTKENGITLLLISHDLHIVRDYSNYLLALNKCVIFFGESKDIMDPSLQKKIYGEPVCVEIE